MNETLGLVHFLVHADGVARFVLSVLLAMSVGTWYLILAKAARLLRRRRAADAFLRAFDDAPDLAALAAGAPADDPFPRLLRYGLAAVRRRPAGARSEDAGQPRGGSAPEEMLNRALKRALDEDRLRLESGQTFLATVASSAPFVGLFGTVWGIHHALLAIGASGEGSLDKVAGPVGEALIMTGFGLAVAIPAAIAYNAFTRANRNALASLSAFAHDVFAILASGVACDPGAEGRPPAPATMRPAVAAGRG